jgi:hypothetical protein
MQKLAALIPALALLVGASLASAQTKAPSPDPVDAKFAAADTDKSGSLEGKELDPYKDKLAMIDANKDGKVSRQEFDVAVKTGLVK